MSTFNGIRRPGTVAWAAFSKSTFRKEIAKSDRGLVEVVAKIPAALAKLGTNVEVTLPLFKQTVEALKEEELYNSLEELETLKLLVVDREIEAVVKKINAPFDPSYPVYFIDCPQFYNRPGIYCHHDGLAYEDELKRAAFFCRAFLEVQRMKGEAPDIIEGHDWQSALIAHYRELFLSRGDNFFKDTKLILGIHAFQYQGIFSPNLFYQAGLGWELRLPPELEFTIKGKRYANLLKGWLSVERTAYARSMDYINEIKTWIYHNQPGFDKYIEESLDKGNLIGLRHADIWNPIEDNGELTDEKAEDGARERLEIYEDVRAGRPLRKALLPPRKKIEEVNPNLVSYYDDLIPEDKKLIDLAIYSGRVQLISNIKTKEDFNDLIRFLQAAFKPDFDFENEAKKEGSGYFLGLFYPGDINGILSSVVDLRSSTNEQLEEYKKQGEAEIYQVLKRLELLPHITGLLKILETIASGSDAKFSFLYGSSPYRVGDLDMGEFKKEHNNNKNTHRNIDKYLAQNGITENSTAEQLTVAFNKLIEIPNFIQLIDDKTDIPQTQQNKANDQTIVKNKEKLAQIYPLTLEKSLSYKTLSQTGRPDPDFKGAVGLETEITEFLATDTIFKRLFFQDPALLCAFIVGVVLHDMGKALKPEEHPRKGVEMMKNIKALRFLFNEGQMDFIKHVIKHHSTLGDVNVSKEFHPNIIRNIYKSFSDDSQRRTYLDTMLIIGWADMAAKGLLNAKDIENLFKIYKAVSNASDVEVLERILHKMGLSYDRFGITRWKSWTVRFEDGEKEMPGSRGEADKELNNYIRRTKRKEGKVNELDFEIIGGDYKYIWETLIKSGYIKDGIVQSKFIGKLKKFRFNISMSAEKRRRIFEIIQKANQPKMTERTFKEILGSMEWMWGMKRTCMQIADPRLRVRFIIRIVELLKDIEIKRCSIFIDDMDKLIEILKNDKYTLLDIRNDFYFEEYDEESKSIKIKLRNPEISNKE